MCKLVNSNYSALDVQESDQGRTLERRSMSSTEKKHTIRIEVEYFINTHVHNVCVIFIFLFVNAYVVFINFTRPEFHFDVLLHLLSYIFLDLFYVIVDLTNV